MYSTCIFCQQRLQRNDAVEAFPVGRRLAFDAQKGRLWVVCPACHRWNLSPIEERWEALEACERLYRSTRQRAATENIGLARLRDGTELIRIGRPLRPEFAAWRYGGRFAFRRRRAALGLGVGALVALGISGGSAALAGGGALGGVLAQVGLNVYGMLRGLLNQPPHVRLDDGRRVQVPQPWLTQVRIRPTGEAEGGWELMVPYGLQESAILRGSHAEAAAAILLPRINRTGASRREVASAVAELEMVDQPLRYFAQAEYRARKRGYGYNPIAQMPQPIRLALEMASHEEAERRALEGELNLLEQAWRHAEEIAAIADTLTLPARVETLLAQYRTARSA